MVGPAAYVVFKGSGRTRLRLPALQHDAEALGHCARSAAEAPGVAAVSFNPVTASVLIEHDGPREGLLGSLEAAGYRILEAADAPQALARQLPSWRPVLASTYLALALLQAARGQVLSPASSLFAAALHLLLPNGQHGPDGPDDEG